MKVGKLKLIIDEKGTLKKVYNDKTKAFLLYAICFIITSYFVFSFFRENNLSFIWKADGMTMHFPVFYDFRENLLKMMRGEFREIPLWSWEIGAGVPFFYILFYDVFSIIGILVPREYIVEAYNITVLVRIFLCGYFMVVYMKQYDVKVVSRVASGLIYAFCGYILYGGIRHPFFINSILLFPLILLGLDKILEGKKPYLFVISIFLAGVNQYYMLYMMAIIGVIYTVVKLACNKEITKLSEAINKIIKIGLFGILGLGIAAIVLLPMIGIYLESNRGETSKIPLGLYSLSHYKQFIETFISSGEAPNWVRLMFPSIALVSTSILLTTNRKEYVVIKYMIIILTIMLCFPIVGWMMTVGNNIGNRWCFMYAFFIAAGVGGCLDFKDKLYKKEYVFIFLGALGYTLFIFVNELYVKYYNLIGIIFLIVFVIGMVGAKYLTDRNNRYLDKAFLILICLNIIFIGDNYYSDKGIHYANEYEKNDEVLKKYDNNYNKIINKINNNTDEFYRVDQIVHALGRTTTGARGRQVSNDGLITNINLISSNTNITNKNIYEFYKEHLIEAGILTTRSYDNRSALNSLLSVRYHVASIEDEKFLPYGYEEVYREKESIIYENKNVLPIGFVYSKYIEKEEYLKVDEINRAHNLLEAVVIERDQDIASINIPKKEVEKYSNQLNYKIVDAESVDIDNKGLDVKKAGGKIILEVDVEGDSEIYVIANGLERSFKSGFDLDVIMDSNLKRKTYGEKESANTLSYSTNDTLINMGYEKENRENVRIEIAFSKKGRYSFKELYVKSLPMTNYESDIRKLKENALENIVYTNNEVSGTLDLKEDGILFMSIPYSKGWKAIVDGEIVDTIKVNTGFIGIPVNKGEHEVTLKYFPPLLKVGIVVSGLSILALIIYVYFTEQKKSNVYKFLLVGGLATLIDYIIYFFLCGFINNHVAKLASIVIAICISFILNTRWTFNRQDKINKQLVVRYIIVQIANIACNVLVNGIVLSITNISIVALIVATTIAMIINYCGQKLYVFR